ncbi:MAG: alpha/beta hydrolase [Anaerolineaceae bacterium]|nr:alpha/beta hydrolase [Anaerolineaceae bacterium]
MKKHLKWLVPLLIVFLVLAGGTIIYINDDYDALPSAAAVLTADRPNVMVTQQPGRIIFRPQTVQAGLVFYPGGKVDYRAYAPLMSDLAARDILCVLVEMPLQLAFLNVNAADSIYGDFPEVKNWYIAGHSLGGAAAASYAAGHKDKLDGLVLLASYAVSDLRNSGLRVLSVYGSKDGVLNRDAYEKNRINLPEDILEVVIPGGNHASFGDYGPQKGDGTSDLAEGEQIKSTAEIISGWIFSK